MSTESKPEFIGSYEIHEAASVYPMLTGSDYEKFRESIRVKKLAGKILRQKGKIVDGRNRLKALIDLGIDPEPYIREAPESVDPYELVVTANEDRRHLTISQRAAIAAKLATMKSGERTDLGQICTRSLSDSAKAMNVSERSVKNARSVQAKGSEEVQKAVEQGVIPVSTAAKLIDAVPDKSEQTKIVEQGKNAVKKVIEAAKPAAPAFEEQQATPLPIEPKTAVDSPKPSALEQILTLAKGMSDADKAKLSEQLGLTKKEVAPEEQVKSLAQKLGVKKLVEMIYHSCCCSGTEQAGLLNHLQKVAGAKKEPVRKKSVDAGARPKDAEEVRAYMKEKGYPDKADKFFDHYEANGWVQGNGRKPIKDWKAAVRTWQGNDFGGGAKASQNTAQNDGDFNSALTKRSSQQDYYPPVPINIQPRNTK